MMMVAVISPAVKYFWAPMIAGTSTPPGRPQKAAHPETAYHGVADRKQAGHSGIRGAAWPLRAATRILRNLSRHPAAKVYRFGADPGAATKGAGSRERGEGMLRPGSGLGPRQRRSGRTSALPYPPSRSIPIVARVKPSDNLSLRDAGLPQTPLGLFERPRSFGEDPLFSFRSGIGTKAINLSVAFGDGDHSWQPRSLRAIQTRPPRHSHDA